MGKKKNCKTYYVFATADGNYGMAAGLGISSCEVKLADKNMLLGAGFRQVGSVFSIKGKLTLEELAELERKHEACVYERVHVSVFLKYLEEYKEKFAKWPGEVTKRKAYEQRVADEHRREAEFQSRFKAFGEGTEVKDCLGIRFVTADWMSVEADSHGYKVYKFTPEAEAMLTELEEAGRELTEEEEKTAGMSDGISWTREYEIYKMPQSTDSEKLKLLLDPEIGFLCFYLPVGE